MEQTHLTNTKFSSLAIPEALSKALSEQGFEFCTPIQAKALPLTLNGANIIGQASTGTGKTLAFLVTIATRLLATERSSKRQPRALVLAPTRELAVQIYNDALDLLKHTDLRCVCAYGGTDYDKQRNQIEAGVDILIGTPGRIIDYFKQRVFDLRKIEAVVLDEADRMFDLGFIKDVRFLLRKATPPDQRLNLMFSATLSYRVIELAYEQMDNPQVVKIESDEVTADNIEQSVYYVSNDEKIPLLLGLIQKLKPERMIVFVNTKAGADLVCGYLLGNDVQAAILSGDVPQKKRQRLVIQFGMGEFPVLVATDVAARGLHIDNVTHVVNFDLPQDAEDYVHRIGRTGRIGQKGMAISFGCETSSFYLPDIEEYIGVTIPKASMEPGLLVKPKPMQRIRSASTSSRRPEQKNKARNSPHKHGSKSSSESAGKPRRRRKPKDGSKPAVNPSSSSGE
ncbi:MAG: DEAD/DEAH box helicase [Gammaproteobacteria bacterium]|nr:DEAD/DEAH box helicase [Gammaproteobacteria bacterium]